MMLTFAALATCSRRWIQPCWKPVLTLGLALLTCRPPAAIAQAIQITGGNLSMNITTAVAGQQPTAVTNTTASLRYRRQTLPTKITVSTNCPGQRFNLAVVATNATGGTPAPQVNLVNGMAATDFITGIPRTGATTKTCILRYTASARFDQGNSAELGNDVHTVTYTLVSQ